MTLRILEEKDREGRDCDFEEWDKEAQAMGTCGTPVVASVRFDKERRFLCKKCAAHAFGVSRGSNLAERHASGVWATVEHGRAKAILKGWRQNE